MIKSVAYVTPAPIPSRAANNIHVMKMCQALGVNGAEVHLLCPAALPRDEINLDKLYRDYGVENCFDIQFFDKRDGKFGRFSGAWQIAGRAKSLNVDLVFSRCLIVAWLCCFIGCKQVIYEIHDTPHALSKLSVFLFKTLVKFKNLLGLITISEALKAHLCEEFRLGEAMVYVAPDGSDPLPEREVGGGMSAFSAGYVGHLYEGRGIEIIAEMARHVPDVHFHIVGGTDEDIALWQGRLADLDNVFFHGFLPHAKASELLLTFNVLLAPYQNKVAVAGGKGDTSRWMSPLKIFEYMATGKAMMCSDIPVLKEVLEHEVNAY
jgi:glycosyltransferase involved in cell wall biosynthesis